MRLKLLRLIPATLLCLCLSCTTRAGTPPHTPQNLPDSSSFPAEIFPTEEKKSPPSPTWDLSDVDISDIDPNRKLLAFTFDDAPGRTLERILAVFAAFNEENPDCKASATVFFNSNRFDSQTPHLLRMALTLGFELGNHTHSHADLTKLSTTELTEEIARTDELLARADGKPYHLLRAPFGRINEEVKALSPTPLIDWTIDTLDWTGVSAEEIYTAVYAARFSGAIALMHDGYEGTVSALKALLPALKEDGYQVVSVSKLAKAHGCVLERGKAYIRARKR